MAIFNTGSVADIVYDRIDDISDNVSGNLLQLSDETRISISNFFNTTINSDNIAEEYQPVMIAGTLASALSEQELQGTDSKSTKLGDLTIQKGGDSNINKTKTFYENKYKTLLLALAKKNGRSITKFKKVNG